VEVGPVKIPWPVPESFPVNSDSNDHLARGQAEAVDFPTPVGTPWLAVHDGHIVVNGWDDAAGWMLVEQWRGDDDRLYQFAWCHADTQQGLPVNAIVQAGQQIGVSGNSGLSTGPHTHCWYKKQEQNGWVRLRPEDWLVQEGDAMTDAERAEINRVAGIFENWARLRRAQQKAAEDFGFGITDSLNDREAAELESAVASLRAL